MKPWEKRMPDDARAVTARVKAHHALWNMGVRDECGYNDLKRILGYSTTIDDGDFCVLMTMRDVETLELIAGPHGYAIYKMLKARSRRP